MEITKLITLRSFLWQNWPINKNYFIINCFPFPFSMAQFPFSPTGKRDLSSFKLGLYSAPPSNSLPPVLTSDPTISSGHPTCQSKPSSLYFIPFPSASTLKGKTNKNKREFSWLCLSLKLPWCLAHGTQSMSICGMNYWMPYSKFVF